MILQTLRKTIESCQRCPAFCGRTQTVFGEGNEKANIVFVGEGPGKDEDKTGRPFVGRAGKLLDNILQAIGFDRGNIYICNVVKCRPPDNRTPTDVEIANCWEYLEAQLSVIKPKYIVCLGSTAARAVLKTEAPISTLRGKWHTYQDIKVLCVYHPAYLLRAGEEAKKKVWDDLQILVEEVKASALQE